MRLAGQYGENDQMRVQHGSSDSSGLMAQFVQRYGEGLGRQRYQDFMNPQAEESRDMARAENQQQEPRDPRRPEGTESGMVPLPQRTTNGSECGHGDSVRRQDPRENSI